MMRIPASFMSSYRSGCLVGASPLLKKRSGSCGFALSFLFFPVARRKEFAGSKKPYDSVAGSSRSKQMQIQATRSESLRSGKGKRIKLKELIQSLRSGKADSVATRRINTGIKSK